MSEQAPPTSSTPSQKDASLIADAKRYRKRAQAAEKELESVKQDLAASAETLQSQTKTIEHLQRIQSVDAQLLEAGAVDMEAARLLVEKELMDTNEPDVAGVIQNLKQRKAYLFHTQVPARSAGVMSPRDSISENPVHDAAQRAAADALTTGRRMDLLHYLRLRRQR